jgi:ribosomal protein S12 methylthiotransferase
VDAEVMITALDHAGWSRARVPEDAECIIVNSCGFIEPAKQESIETCLQFASEFPDARIIMAGCLSERYPTEIAGEIPELAAVVGNRDPAAIPAVLDEITRSPKRVFVPGPPRAAATRDPGSLLSLPGSAFLKVSEGCNNRCSFCAIPLIRGGLRSRPIREIAGEARMLLDAGVAEINLVAQDLASFGRDTGESLADLLRALLRDQRQFWLRMLYVYPERFPLSLLDLCRDDPRLLPYFDIPFQHAATDVLRRMGRPSTADESIRLVRTIREALPDVFLRSTFLVGFYGEGESEFESLLRFQEEAALDWVGVFVYSPEDGTPAMRYEGTLTRPSAEVAEERRDLLRSRQEPITESRLDRLVGRELPVLVEELVPHEPLAIGRAYAQAPEVDGSVVIALPASGSAITPGAMVPCRVLRRIGVDVEAAPL